MLFRSIIPIIKQQAACIAEAAIAFQASCFEDAQGDGEAAAESRDSIATDLQVQVDPTEPCAYGWWMETSAGQGDISTNRDSAADGQNQTILFFMSSELPSQIDLHYTRPQRD